MANRTLSDLPAVTTIDGADIIHTRQSITDKSVTQLKNAEYAMNLSAYAPSVVAVTGTTHTISTTINKQLLICTISSNCTMTFPGTFGDNQEITILNSTSSTANVLGLPNSEILYPGQEITFVWNGSSFIKKNFITNFIVDTAAPTITPNFVGQIFINETSDVIYVSTGTASSADWTQLANIAANIKSTAVDYTILDDDGYNIIEVPHTASTGLVTITLPTVADNIGRRIRIQNLGDGLTKIDGEGSETISFKGASLSLFYLYLEDDYIDLYSTGTDWRIYGLYSHIKSGWYNRSDWTNVHIGFSNFVYDNQSDSTDLTGQHFTEATSNNTGIVLKDSAPTGNAGTLTVYLVTGTGIFTNDRQITFGDARTCDVDEATSNKNDDNNVTHNLNTIIQTKNNKIYYNTTASYTGAFEIPHGIEDAASNYGYQKYIIDSNDLKNQLGAAGFTYFDDAGNQVLISTDDSYCNTELNIKV